ncbi:hypothetical protein EfmAA242_12730 [Enterococcus faecium]|nr:hypothetical protein EfmAA242_12730 [Enterococcus faecium]
MYMPTMRADDVVYASRLDELGYLGASIEHYKTWSSRIIIELFLMFFSTNRNTDTRKNKCRNQLTDTQKKLDEATAENSSLKQYIQKLEKAKDEDKVNDNQFTEKRTSL